MALDARLALPLNKSLQPTYLTLDARQARGLGGIEGLPKNGPFRSRRDYCIAPLGP